MFKLEELFLYRLCKDPEV